MSAIAPIILLIITASLMWLYGWRLVLAITLSVTLIPFIVLPGSEVYDRVVKGEEASLPFSDIFVVAGLIAFFGWLFYMLLIAPLYVGLKALGFSMAAYFPLAVALIVALLFFFLAAQPVPFWGWGLVALCGYVHAWLILWVMGRHQTRSTVTRPTRQAPLTLTTPVNGCSTRSCALPASNATTWAGRAPATRAN